MMPTCIDSADVPPRLAVMHTDRVAKLTAVSGALEPLQGAGANLEDSCSVLVTSGTVPLPLLRG